jgi:hypothetical protein
VELRHATSRKLVPAIRREGLLVPRSQGRLPAVWLHAPGRSAWAALHTVRRHGGRAEGVVILTVEVPRSCLRHRQRGLWYCPRDVPPGRIATVIDFSAVSASPVRA